MLQPRVLFSPVELPVHCSLTPHQSAKVFHLAGFITSTKRILQAKGDKVLEHMQSLTDRVGMPQDTCLCLILQVLELFPTIPLDISFHAQFPMMLPQGPELLVTGLAGKLGGNLLPRGEGQGLSYPQQEIKSRWLDGRKGPQPRQIPSQAHSHHHTHQWIVPHCVHIWLPNPLQVPQCLKA